MGLITGILGLPLAPLWGTVKVGEHVLAEAEDAYYNPAAIRAELEEIDRLRETGGLTDDEATAREDELVDRLMEGQRLREERG